MEEGSSYAVWGGVGWTVHKSVRGTHGLWKGIRMRGCLLKYTHYDVGSNNWIQFGMMVGVGINH